MHNYLSMCAAGTLLLAGQTALAGSCDPDTTSPLRLSTNQVTFNVLNASQTIQVRNLSPESMKITTPSPGNAEWVAVSGCDGEILTTDQDCSIDINFYPSPDKSEYHGSLVVTGVTMSGEYSQTLCLDGTN